MSMNQPGGQRRIKRLLVANRGEIARRIIRTCRETGISPVTVFSTPDSSSPHVAEADAAIHLPGASAAETYLDIKRLIGAAERSGADAIHPGYGFLAENAQFAEACASAGLTFVGPPARVIEAMGSKLAAKKIMADAGVPVLPTIEIGPDILGAGQGGGDGGAGGATTPGDIEQSVVAQAEALGWPVLVKASAGGGGRGMRIVGEPGALVEAIRSAAREAASAFGDGTVFLEPYVVNPRHIEVQILGDAYGDAIHLFERECSIQRRHQKIIEECPSPAVDDMLRRELGDAAVRAAKAIGYVGAGTVEFVMRPDGSFAFLEVNTRIQVEHPVTEMVTGLDLVRSQLDLAMGCPIGPELRSATITGHAVEARIYAEDPAHDWQPSTGTLYTFDVPHPPGIRLDSGVESSSVISPYYDSMLAKVIAHSDTREGALALLASALSGARIHGPVTNRDLLVSVLTHPEVIEGRIDTAFLERFSPAELGSSPVKMDQVPVYALAAALAAQARRRLATKVLAGAPSGWRNNPTLPQIVTFDVESTLANRRGEPAGGGGEGAVGGAEVVMNGARGKTSEGGRSEVGKSGSGGDKIRVAVGYEFDRYGKEARLYAEEPGEPSEGPDSAADQGQGEAREPVDNMAYPPKLAVRDDLKFVSTSPDETLIEDAGLLARYSVGFAGGRIFVDGPAGSLVLTEADRFPSHEPGEDEIGSLQAPLPGTVTRVIASEGQEVEAGDLLLTLEAMKLEHEIRTPHGGIVTTLHVAVGDQVEAGAQLAVVSNENEDTH